jgi:hypothetical protein
MPVRWEFRPGLVVVISSGVYPNDAVEDAIRQAAADPRFEPGMAVLFDGRESEVALSSANIAWRVELFASLPRRGFQSRVAILVREGFVYWLSAGEEISISADGEPVRLRLYNVEEDAVAWLRRA